MGKRSDYDRFERDYYPTPLEAVLPLFTHLPLNTRFIEPCAGDGRLIRHIESRGGNKCVYACDLEPQAEGIETRDILFFRQDWPECDYFITNTPWEREVLHPMITMFIQHAPCWLLFDSDWMHTIQAAPYMPHCQKIVSVGRVKWIEGTDNTGVDNACWYLFDRVNTSKTIFVGR